MNHSTPPFKMAGYVMFLNSTPIKKYQFTSLENVKNPIPLCQELLRDGPLARTKISFIGKVWLATSWKAASTVLRDQDRFIRDARRLGRKSPTGFTWFMPRMFKRLASNLLVYDKEDHRRLRSLADQAFMRSEVNSLRPRIRQICNELLDQLEQEAKKNNGNVDLCKDFSKELPLAIITEILGLPKSDRPQFRKWFKGFSEVKSFWGIFKLLPSISKTMKYLEKQFDEVRKNPRPGLMTDLVMAEHEGNQLTPDELLSMVFVLLLAGHETTVHSIGNSVLTLLDHPTQKQQLLNDWELLPSAVDEILRYSATTQIAKPRLAFCDMEFEGQLLSKGDLVVPALAAANMDPEKFDQPTVFDITRKPNPYLTFGSGVHICLGLKLAKAEIEIATQELFTRFPNLSVSDSEHAIKWMQRIGMRGVKKLEVNLG